MKREEAAADPWICPTECSKSKANIYNVQLRISARAQQSTSGLSDSCQSHWTGYAVDVTAVKNSCIYKYE